MPHERLRGSASSGTPDGSIENGATSRLAVPTGNHLESSTAQVRWSRTTYMRQLRTFASCVVLYRCLGGPSYGSRPSDSPDGQAIAFVRGVLAEDGVRSTHPWRTMVLSDEDGWVVRTWTETPADLERSVGRPQCVHRVRPAPVPTMACVPSSYGAAADQSSGLTTDAVPTLPRLCQRTLGLPHDRRHRKGVLGSAVDGCDQSPSAPVRL